MAVTTADITKAAKELASLESKLAKLVSNENAIIERAKAKAATKYAAKINEVKTEIGAARLRLKTLAEAA